MSSIEKACSDLSVEIIVVDNDSQDGSVTYLEPLFPNVDFIALSENIGFGSANNVGIKQAKGRYILILNPDTILSEKTLKIMTVFMDANPRVGISGCKVLNADGTFQQACRRGFPTPWVSFCKLFGLQTLFPKSRIFARYNQTFRDVDETCEIESVIGAFMFVRRKAIDECTGFDEDFFMYGEDIDLCWRVFHNGWKIVYYPATTIIHYKGESTKRSSINELRHFYQAMAIFSRKHFAYSLPFLMLLRLGIYLRSCMAFLNKNRTDLGLILTDIVAINVSLLTATWLRFGDFLGFPEYAYPTVFVAISIVLFGSMIAVGEYFESKPTIRKSLFGLMITFFVLSSLTYFFNQFAFSRGAVLMTIAFTSVLTTFVRGIIGIRERVSGSRRDRRVVIIGNNQQAQNIINTLQKAEMHNANLLGVVTITPIGEKDFSGLPVLGSISYLPAIIKDYNIHEVIVTDTTITHDSITKMMEGLSNPSVRFHIAREYEDVLSSRIINEITGTEPTIPQYNLSKFRFKLVKRISDVLISIFLLTLGLPIVYIVFKKENKIFVKLLRTLRGKMSFVGLYKVNGKVPTAGKQGITGLAHISHPEHLSDNAIANLNHYYQQNFSLSLDLDIILKYVFRLRKMLIK